MPHSYAYLSPARSEHYITRKRARRIAVAILLILPALPVLYVLAILNTLRNA